MGKRILVKLEEVKNVFCFLEKVHDLLHQPLEYQRQDVVEKFAAENYEEAKRLYYDVVWEWLPDDVKAEFEDR